MRRGLALLLFLFGCTTTPTPLPVVQELSGVISDDLTLSGEILLVGDLLLRPGRTLTVLPGTTIRIRTSESTKIDPEYLSSFTEILIRGTLKAEGRADAPIAFLPETPVANGEVAWAGIILDNSTSFIRHGRIEGAEQGVLAIGGSPQLRDNVIQNCRYGLVLQGTTGGTLSDNKIESGEGGLFLLAGARADVVGNRITGQAEEGLFVDATSLPRLERNEISHNEIGVLLHNPDVTFDPSGMTGNREDLRRVGRE